MTEKKRTTLGKIFFLGNIFVASLLANSLLLMYAAPFLIPVFLLLFVFINFFPALPPREIPCRRLKRRHSGAMCLKLFCVSCGISVLFHIILAFALFRENFHLWAGSAAVCLCVLAVLFWNGMIRVYLFSVQLGIRHRVVGLLCGFIPILNLIMLLKIIRIVSDEVSFETEKAKLDSVRAPERICRTKYPVLLVHGVFFRDRKFPNYWGRIPEELIRNGAEIYYGNHESAASVPDAGRELAARIREIVTSTGCGKVNIIAHSKGGLDCRFAISRLSAAPYVASLTTINTPHHGCEFADYLLQKIPGGVQKKIAHTYNAAMKKLGDKNPDFMAAVKDLTAKRCEHLNAQMAFPETARGIVCLSVGSKLNRASSGKFPLNFTYPLVKYFDGPNDGLVSEHSFRWGGEYRLLTVEGKRGISHGDVIDLNRENIPGFDVREFYVELLSDLRSRGL